MTTTGNGVTEAKRNRRRWLPVLLLICGVLAAGAIVFLAGKGKTSIQAYILVMPPRTGEARRVLTPQMMDRIVANQAEIMTCQEVYRAAAGQDKIAKTQWGRRQGLKLISALQLAVKIRPLEGKDFIVVSMAVPRNASRKELAESVDIVNAVAEQAVRYIREKTNGERRRERAILDSQQTALREEVNRLQAELETASQPVNAREAEAKAISRREKVAQIADLQGKHADLGKRILDLDLLLSGDQMVSLVKPAEVPPFVPEPPTTQSSH